MNPSPAHHVVIVGGGFGGLHAVKALKRSTAKITLVDRRNFHLFQPLLYQVATGGLSPANIATPLRSVLRKQRNVSVLLGEVVGLQADQHQVILRDGNRIAYDSLIIATGSRHFYFGHHEWESIAPGLKTVEDATRMRSRILNAFEQAELTDDPAESTRSLTFVVVGGGPTGVELAGALGELTQRTLRKEFRRIDPSDARILLIEGEDRLVPMYPPQLSMQAQKSLERLGVSVRCNARVTEMTERSVTILSNGTSEVIPTRTVLWAAGVRASRLGQTIAAATGAELDHGGRVIVDNDCTIPGSPDVFVIGDLAAHRGQDGRPLPGLAQVAIQQGEYVADVIQRRLRDERAEPFAYRNYGEMSTIGRAAAVAQIGDWEFSGVIAWLAWLLVHLVQLVGFENRLLVFIQWAGNYVTRNRAARLITETNSMEQDECSSEPVSNYPDQSQEPCLISDNEDSHRQDAGSVSAMSASCLPASKCPTNSRIRVPS
ncbi:MAG: NAD(P)/FAD-dependent oxidoreductase [Planctomycetaceae bacterium]|nr:NAD(P)/FAD-dependent oxidoreductase [Planctomycetaceae bacterium]